MRTEYVRYKANIDGVTYGYICNEMKGKGNEYEKQQTNNQQNDEMVVNGRTLPIKCNNDASLNQFNFKANFSIWDGCLSYATSSSKRSVNID
jgi:hypothetical protein